MASKINEIWRTTYEIRGDAYEAKSQHDRAIAEYSNAIQVQPSANLYVKRGNANRANGNSDLAILDYTEAIARDPENATFYRQRGAMYQLDDKNDLAVRDYRRAIELNPRYVVNYFDSADALFASGYFLEAASDLRKAIQRGTTNRNAVIKGYLARFWAGQEDEAEAELVIDASRLKGLDPVIKLYLGKQTLEETEKEYDDLIYPEYDRCEFRFFIAEWHFLKQDREKAEEVLKGVINNCPSSEGISVRAELKRLQSGSSSN